MSKYKRHGKWFREHGKEIRSLILSKGLLPFELCDYVSSEIGKPIRPEKLTRALKRAGFYDKTLARAIRASHAKLVSSALSNFWGERHVIELEQIEKRAKKNPKVSGYIAGMVLSDGHIILTGKDGQKRSEVGMRTVYEPFASFCESKWKKIFGPRVSIGKSKNTSVFENSRLAHPVVFTVCITSKAAALFTEKIILPSYILSASPGFQVGFLQGVYDGDGYVKRQTKTGKVDAIGLTSGDPSTIRVAGQLLERNSISSSVETRKNIWVLYTFKQSEIKKFADLVGFRLKHRAKRLSVGLKSVS